MQADDAAIMGMSEATRDDLEVSKARGTQADPTINGVSAATVHDEKLVGDKEKNGHGVAFANEKDGHHAGVAVREDPHTRYPEAPVDSEIFEGELGQHLPDEALYERPLTWKSFVFGNKEDLRQIELPTEEEKLTLRRVPDSIILATCARSGFALERLADVRADLIGLLVRAGARSGGIRLADMQHRRSSSASRAHYAIS
jgi:hypothetical protein